MYEIDDQDTIRKLDELPQSSVGAPIPYILDGELWTVVAYYVERHDPDWDGTSVRVVGPNSGDEQVAIVRFRKYAAYSGPPNDEAFSGHPLHARGLKPYGFFEVENSSWIRRLERMNSVHPYHDKKRFLENRRHFILSFHDSIFECIAESFELVEVRPGSVVAAINSVVEMVASDS